MTCQLFALGFDANDPQRVARFWAGVLGWELTEDTSGGWALLPDGSMVDEAMARQARTILADAGGRE